MMCPSCTFRLFSLPDPTRCTNLFACMGPHAHSGSTCIHSLSHFFWLPENIRRGRREKDMLLQRKVHRKVTIILTKFNAIHDVMRCDSSCDKGAATSTFIGKHMYKRFHEGGVIQNRTITTTTKKRKK
ncbi:hypothetical protein, unlikely [Trypanosoma brucei gambiense DAL972]|uniref:Uncharacterized protein n=1 Tax=Trypanosoma brucei gambiense (strain MHOM/CI/86/DAL972) TaxID=679716 RepID=C9ZWQ6_TRYB9|nr:hypothetical protein, unlikely [Trypanosoma brucei gambiense DAL972]CBH13845.1 hypothetical protein, unlikely [Trypanosoma brucei gambiense DAL972]|eukprot:XP_011776121.1 hypothetical protein, unlikely [Trypanosoma brucei gambiense DAL972]